MANKMTRRVASVAAGLTLTGLTAIGAVNSGGAVAEGGRQQVSAPAADQAGFFTIIKWTWVGGRWVQTRTIQCFPQPVSCRKRWSRLPDAGPPRRNRRPTGAATQTRPSSDGICGHS